jgi:hypothetical protein
MLLGNPSHDKIDGSPDVFYQTGTGEMRFIASETMNMLEKQIFINYLKIRNTEFHGVCTEFPLV